MALADKTMWTLSCVYLIVILLSVSVQADRNTNMNTRSRSYFDQLSQVSKIAQRKQHLENRNVQEKLNQVSQAFLSLTRTFSEPSQNKQFRSSSGGNDEAGNMADIQKLLLSASETLAAEENSTSACLNDTVQFIMGIFSGEAWAVQFLDSFGKPGPGLTLGRLNFVGSYAQCRAASALSTYGERRFHGNYCILKANFGPATLLGQAQVGIQLGACVPDSCSESQSTVFVSTVINMLNLTETLQAGTTECHTDQREMTTATLAAIALIIIIVLMILAGTIFDIVVVQWPKWEVSSAGKEGLITNGLASQGHGYTIIGAENPILHSDTTHLLSNVKVGKQGGNPQGICSKVLLAFSVYTNGSKVLNTSQPSGSLGAIHGIRFLSMCWVLLGHFFIFGIGEMANLGSEFPILLRRWTFDAVSNAFASVDTFFAMSGLLTAYLTLTEIRKRGWKINWALFYFHRFWRLTPPYMLTLVIVLGLQQYLGSGALWPSVQPADKENCESNWWTNLLYVNNLVDSENMCFGHSWYLANDMQFFLLSPLMFVPFYFNVFLGLASCVGFLLISWISTGVLSNQGNWPAALVAMTSEGNENQFLLDYYFKPWCRIGVYVVGVLAGSCLAINNGKINMKWYVALLGWALAAAAGLAVVYGLNKDISGEELSDLGLRAFYNAVARSAWGACVCWVIIACASGHGGFVNTILSWSPFVVLGRFTYMAYLVHPALIYAYFQNQEQLFYVTDTSVVVSYCGLVVVVNMFAFVLMLALESPWIGLERVFIHKKGKE